MEDPIEAVVKPSNMLTLTAKEESRALVVSAAKNVLAGTDKNLGVSLKWLANHVEKLDLNQEQVEMLISIRTEYSGLIAHAVKFLHRGFTVEEICGCYRIQRELADQGKEYNASVKKIAKLILCFQEADPDNDNLAQVISEAHESVSSRYFWVRYIDQTISILCAVAKKYECVSIGSAISMIENRQSKLDGVVNDDEQDEVDRQRIDWEERNPFRGKY